MFEKLFMKSLLYSNIYIAVPVTFCVTIYRTALIATYPNVKTLMCYFHVVNCCKKNLRSHPAANQKLVYEGVYYLHTSISQTEFEFTYTEVAGKWRRDFPEFARYFSAQWILGTFTNWKIDCSEPGSASTKILWSYLKMPLRSTVPDWTEIVPVRFVPV
jgi:hypothetical protein